MDSATLRLWQRSRYVRFAYLCLLAVVIPLLVWNGFVQQINSAFSDILLRMRPSPTDGAVRDVVLLAIDDATLARYGPLPLKRSTLAAASSEYAACSAASSRLRAVISREIVTEPMIRPSPACIGAAEVSKTRSPPSCSVARMVSRVGRAMSRLSHSHPKVGTSRRIEKSACPPDRNQNRSLLPGSSGRPRRADHIRRPHPFERRKPRRGGLAVSIRLHSTGDKTGPPAAATAEPGWCQQH